MSEAHLRPNRHASGESPRMMVPLWAIFVGILALQALVVAIGFRVLG